MYKWLRDENIMSLPDALRFAVETNPHKIAIDYVLKVKPIKIGKFFKFNFVVGKKMSYEEVGEMVRKFSSLLDSKLEKRDFSETVGIFMLNCPQFWGAYFGTQLSKSIPLLISLATIVKELRAKKRVEEVKITEEIKSQILDAKPRIIVATDFLWPILAQMRDELKDTVIILTRLSDFLPSYVQNAYRKEAIKDGRWVEEPFDENVYMLSYLFSGSLEKFLPKPWNLSEVVPKNQIAHLIYTGGTTGTPKGAMTSHANIMSNILQCREQFDEFINEGDSVFGALPFFHSYGLTTSLMSLLNIGGSLVFSPTFEPKPTAYLLKKKKIRVFIGINRMFKALLAVPAMGILPHLRFCISGAGKLDLNIKEEFERVTSTQICEGYGLTEASPVVSVTLPREDKLGTIGRPLPGTEVKVVDLDTRQEVSPDKTGELVVHGPQVMTGYYKRPDETAKVLVDGWLRTGDTVYQDQDGFLYFVGREKEMSKINGENVYWLEVERHFLTSEPVEKCAVIGVPRPNYEDEQLLVVFVVLKEGKTVGDLKEKANLASSKNWLIKEIAPISEKIFAEWEDAIGKVQKRKVKVYYEESARR